MRVTRVLVVVVLGLLTATAVCAGSTVNLVGDKDCFGLGGTCPDGKGFVSDLGGQFFQDYRGPGDGLYTDLWDDFGAVSFNHVYALPTGIITATLELKIAGIHDINQLQVYDVLFDGTIIGVIPPNVASNNFEEVLTYTFNVPIGLLSGNDTVAWSGTGGDGYIIDYSQLTINTTVPEPATLVLLGSGILAMGAAMRRRLK